jgi:putative heme-binding domain-containing protein
MNFRGKFAAFVLLIVGFLSVAQPDGANAEPPMLEFSKGDHVAIIGNTLADRMQHDGWLETYIQALFPELELSFRNLGFAADEVANRPRSESFGEPNQWLTKCQADVVFCFFGYNEALRGRDALGRFEKDLAAMIDDMRGQKYNGQSPPQLVICSPIAHQNLASPHLPDGTENNEKLALYTAAMREVCAEKNVLFVDLFTPTKQYYLAATEPMTINGIHLTEYGNKVVAGEIIRNLFPGRTAKASVAKLREAVLDKNFYWFSRYRVVDGYNVYGGRSKLAWDGKSNADVMQREMEIFDVMTANRDQRIWAIAQGGDLEVRDDNLPEQVAVVTNKKGPNPDGSWPYRSGQEGIAKMEVAKGMEVNLFASEEKFPRLVNPVQMAVDTDSRLWVSVWPSYPHWNPTEPRRDAIVILPDENGDGEADELIVFADELNSVTGFEFWNGGVLVAAPPEIWFLKDTDGDDRADQKIRMLQGVSSADTHHSANAMLIGPDGWLYYSRGIFNVANFETPTKTFRSGASGVHRFNPRTFEFEFHFPIGPNPHGDVFDRWGYQFANDGTGGTGSYVNIGKGQGNKEWFKKRVRPVAATGILSSSHFPDENQGNFLICNTIGVLGVLQHEVRYNGADITAHEIEPILVSSDPNFRPSDVEIGGDGALYVADWHNTLIGHMQHNMRDPNRDHEHGRIYRVTATGRQLSTPAKMRGKPISEVCEHFFDVANSNRYRARLELSSRSADEIVTQVQAFADGLNPRLVSRERDQAQALLECLWVFEEQRLPNIQLLAKVVQADEPRVRAAAIRTLGHWAGRGDGWQEILTNAANDPSPLVRAEAVKAAVEFADDEVATEALLAVAGGQTDPELDAVIRYAKRTIDIDQHVDNALAAGRPLSPAAQGYVLKNGNVGQLSKLPPSAAVSRAMLSRPDATMEQMSAALATLAAETQQLPLDALLDLIDDARKNSAANLLGLGRLLVSHTPEQLQSIRGKIESIAVEGETPELKRLGYAAWVAAAGPGDAFLSASQDKQRLQDFLDAVPSVDESVRGQLYDKILPLISELPSHLPAETSTALAEPGIQVEYFHPSVDNVAIETLDQMQPQATGIVPQITIDVPQRAAQDQFALRFSGQLQVPKSGQYTFYLSSDDGSRLYLDGKELIDNDGLHGVNEKYAKVELAAGGHPLVVTYFDNGGGDALSVAWRGPGFKKQSIAADQLSISGGESLHDAAIVALSSIPGHDTGKFNALAALLAAGKSRDAAIAAIRQIPESAWSEQLLSPLADNLVGYLSSIPPRSRTTAAANQAVELTKSIAAKLPADRAESLQARLGNLDVRVIAIGTVSHRMIYDKETIVVAAGKPVEFRFSNTDAMPHNFAIVQPGSLAEVGELAEETGRDPDALERHFIPVSDKVLLGSKLLQPGENQSLSFDVPTEPGVYPYVCTYPGHWRRMYGALYVVADWDQYQANPETYLANAKLPIQDPLLELNTRSHAWTYDELAAELDSLMHGRSFDVGRELFKVASCTGCHKLNDEGVVFGPDLTKLADDKQTPQALLRSLLEPSLQIDEKFQSKLFVLDDGRTITGMVVDETADAISVVINPLAKDKPTVIDPSTIEAEKKSEVSLMPTGLLDRLSREEILDLIGYVYAKGDRDHMIYESHSHQH